jgi:protein LTV1
MSRKKDAFIDRKKAVTFTLVHRSQRDPLLGTAGASDYVLKLKSIGDRTPAEAAPALTAIQRLFADEEGLLLLEENDKKIEEMEGRDVQQATGGAMEKARARARLEGKRRRKRGLHDDLDHHDGLGLPRDGYDYSRHLREIGVVKGSVFVAKDGNVVDATTVVDPTLVAPGVFGVNESELTPYREFHNSAGGMQQDIDLEVAAKLNGLDDDGDDDEELEDDFMALALADDETFEREMRRRKEEEAVAGKKQKKPAAAAPPPPPKEEDEEDYYDDEEDDGDGEEDEFWGEDDGHVERESLESTMSRRTQSVRLVDEQFDLALSTYDDDGVQDDEAYEALEEKLLSHEEIDGYLDEFLLSRAVAKPQKTEIILGDLPEDVRTATKLKAKELEERDVEDLPPPDMELPSRPRWDCETIVSTYSNLENRPKVIAVARIPRHSRIRINAEGLPADFLPSMHKAGEEGGVEDGEGDGEEGSEEEEEEEEEVILVAARTRGETAEQKKERKRAVKEAKKLARERKKTLKAQFKVEEIKQAHQSIRQPKVSIRPME